MPARENMRGSDERHGEDPRQILENEDDRRDAMIPPAMFIKALLALAIAL